jgi:hypothetical protein
MYEKGCLRTPETKPSSKYIRLQLARIINKMNEVQKRIIVSYTPDQEGEDIKDEDVTKKPPMVFQGWWGNINVEGQELGKMPDLRQLWILQEEWTGWEIEPRYVILIDRNKILDSITLAQMLNQGHETAKADRMYHPRMNKIKPFSTDHIGFGVDLWFFDEQDPLVKAELLRELNWKYNAMLEWPV